MNGTLATYTKEFVAICSHLERTHPEHSTDTSLFIPQKQLLKLLDRNKYEESQTKLAVWRNLQWIDCEPGRFTKSITHEGKRKRVVALNCSVYRQLQAFLDR